MKIVHTIEDLRQALAPFDSLAFVPTMGNLHEGHFDLVRHARTLGNTLGSTLSSGVVASIFVNRLQFAPHEDFDSYPRTLQADCAQLQALGCDVVFAPREHDLYPVPQTFTVQPPPELANILEGHFRPGFFTGVCTVVLKLFQCVFAHTKGAQHAVFGKKDYQQQMMVARMCQQLALPVHIAAVDTRRAPDGLALSSRNGYLSATQRTQAVALWQALQHLGQQAQQLWQQHPQATDAQLQAPLLELEQQAAAALNAQGWATDYLTVRKQHDLQAPTRADAWVVLGAARLGATRLIDNLELP